MPPRRKRKTDSEDEDCIVVGSAQSIYGTASDQLPSGWSQNPGASQGRPAAQVSKAKRHQIATACSHCRDAKLKCTGTHPTCARCETRGVACVYDVAEEGVTKREHLRRRYEEQRSEFERATTVLGLLQNGTDCEAAELLARLRLGDSVDQVYNSLSDEQDASFRGAVSPAITHFGFAAPSAPPRFEFGATEINQRRGRSSSPSRSGGHVPIANLSPLASSPSLSRDDTGGGESKEGHFLFDTSTWPNFLDPDLDVDSGSMPQQGCGSTVNPLNVSQSRIDKDRWT